MASSKRIDLEANYIDHKDTGFFSSLIEDYLSGNKALYDFYQFRPDENGLKDAILERMNYPVNRKVLVDTLKAQYQHLALHEAVAKNIASLGEEHTFTVCTAHQPNLMTGYLYFFYKIIHAVKLALFLKEKHPDKHFVPVFYMGSEDNDLEELGTFRYGGSRFKWETEQKGAVGRMTTADLLPLIEALKSKIGPPGPYADRLKETITEAYEGQQTIADATRYVINAFLGSYGVIVLDADDSDLKKNFRSVIKEELFNPQSMGLVAATSEKLNNNYMAQAYSRPINLFYLKDNVRERIVEAEGKWSVINTGIVWESHSALQAEVDQHPERFSPNVILRGLYQESLLPNVAFIGGGSEVAYWMQLKSLFEYYKVFFPPLILRQSVLWMNKKEATIQAKTNLSDQDIFLPEAALIRQYILHHTSHQLSLQNEKEDLQRLFTGIHKKAVGLDKSLQSSTEAALTKMNYQLQVLEKKLFRAEKRNMSEKTNQIKSLKMHCFPGESLQERFETFMPYYLSYGDLFFETLLNHTLPFGDQFLILKDV